MHALEIKDVTVRFGGVVPVDAVTVTMEYDAWGLIGPNGAGKTTMFNVLSGFVKPSRGAVVVDGTDITGMPAYQRARWGIRRTFQTEQAIANLSVLDNVKLAADHVAGGKSGQGMSVDDILEFTGLADSATVRCAGLDMLGRRRVEFARALVGAPRLVLLDEPAAGLPSDETVVIRDLIRAIPEQTGASVVLVDHDMSLVSTCCSHLAVLDFGKLLASGPVHDVLSDPVVLAAYLGESAGEAEGTVAS